MSHYKGLAVTVGVTLAAAIVTGLNDDSNSLPIVASPFLSSLPPVRLCAAASAVTISIAASNPRSRIRVTTAFIGLEELEE